MPDLSACICVLELDTKVAKDCAKFYGEGALRFYI